MMMIMPKAGFVCDYCGEFYQDKQDAVTCEKQHTGLSIEPYAPVGNLFPTEIFVKYKENNKLKQYCRYIPDSDGVQDKGN
jgi:hypothetical protein